MSKRKVREVMEAKLKYYESLADYLDKEYDGMWLDIKIYNECVDVYFWMLTRLWYFMLLITLWFMFT